MLKLHIQAALAATILAIGALAVVVGFSGHAVSTPEPFAKGDRLATTADILDICSDKERAEYGADCIEAIVDADNAKDIRYISIGGQVAPATTVIAKVPVKVKK